MVRAHLHTHSESEYRVDYVVADNVHKFARTHTVSFMCVFCSTLLTKHAYAKGWLACSVTYIVHTMCTRACAFNR